MWARIKQFFKLKKSIDLSELYSQEELQNMSDEQMNAIVVQVLCSMADEAVIEATEFSQEMGGAQTQTQSRTSTQITYPNRYNVIFLNDDFTPMDFVIQLLVEIFNKSIDQAQDLTLAIHNEGSAVVGTYSKEIADQKTHEAVIACQHSGHPPEILCEPM